MAVDNTDDQPTIIAPDRSSLPPSPPPPPYVVGESPTLAGRKLGNYELIEAVGAGGMAAVIKARDTELGRIVALKILPPDSAQDPETVLRFKQEARAAAKLDHENIARVYSCGEDQGLHFIAFEFVEGTNLRTLIERRGPLPASECVAYMLQVAAGLAHAAERGVVHRDIKPSNIIVTPQGKAKIVDMGLARLDTTPINGAMTQSGVTLGTFDYISPEQALDPRRADVRSDIYSLGCTFYHALTGRPPVPEGTAARKLQAHQHQLPLDPRQLNPAIPDGLAIILARMMMKDPNRRYQTPADLIVDLKRLAPQLQHHLGAPNRHANPSTTPLYRGHSPGPPRIPTSLLLALASLVILVVALASTSSSEHAFPLRSPWPEHPPATASNSNPGKSLDPVASPTRDTNTKQILTPAHAEELPTRVTSSAKTLHVRLAQPRYDLTSRGWHFAGEAGQSLILEGMNEPVEIQVSASADRREHPGSGSILISGYESVRLKNIRVVTTESDDRFRESEQGLLTIRDVRTIRLSDCQFASVDGPLPLGCPAVVVTSTDQQPANVRLERCLLLPGWVGLRLDTEVDLRIDDCGFAPQSRAAILLHPKSPEVSRVTLYRSSFMTQPNGSVIESDESTHVQVSSGYCVFASVAEAPADSSALLLLKGESPLGVRFDGEDGQRNVYHLIQPLALQTREGIRFHSFEECLSKSWPIQDRGGVFLKRRPWAADLASVWSRSADWPRAFRLLPDNELFVAHSIDGVKFVGVRLGVSGRTEWGLTYETPFVRPASTPIREKVWWPTASEDEELPPGTYRDLAVLLLQARSGDTVRIRHDGPVMLKPLTVARNNSTEESAGDFQLTFKPYEDSNGRCRPILSIKPNDRLDASLFTLEEGEMTFEDLHFHISAAHRGGLVWRHAVSLYGARRCSFRSCLFTLDDDGGKATVVSLNDADGRMMTPASSSPIQIRFENCLLRGKGRWLWLPNSRPFEMDVVNCVTALDGPLVVIDPAARVASEAHSRLRLKRLTALLTGPLLELRASKTLDGGYGVVPMNMEVEDCLLASISPSSRPLIEVDGLPPEIFRDVLTWARPLASSRPNWYANFDPALAVVEFQPTSEGATTRKWDWREWFAFGERPIQQPLGRMTFAALPRDLASLAPADLKISSLDFPDMPQASPGDVGANLELLPKP